MLNVGLLADGKASCFEASHTELHAIDRHDFHRMGLKVGQESSQREHPLWDGGLEFRVPGKDDNRPNGVRGQEL